jgi:cytochrome c556
MRFTVTARAAAFAALAIAIPVLAAAPADIVKQRHDAFKTMGGAFKTINDAVKSGATDTKPLAAPAATMVAQAKLLTTLFPAGTGPDKVKTHALPTVWSQNAEFKGLQAKLVAENGKLQQAVASGSIDAVKAQIPQVGGTCKSCHDKFRAKDS